jgi:hypothetical protein
MSLGSLSGRAPRASTTDPIGMGECDRCRFWYSRTQLGWQYQWSGARLINTGLLVCRGSGTNRCMDIPFEQYRVLILPGDPEPIRDARPGPNVTPPAYAGLTPPTDPFNQGFTPFELGTIPQASAPWNGYQGTPQAGGYPPGYPGTKIGTLRTLAAMTGIPIPSQIFERSGVIHAPNVAVPLMGTQPGRGWCLIYNPQGSQAEVALTTASPPVPVASATAIMGMASNLPLGPGLAFFCAFSQGLGPCYAGAMAAIGLLPGMPFWAWESAYPYMWLTDDFGNPITDDYGQIIWLDSLQQPSQFVNDGGVLAVTNAFTWPILRPSGPGVWTNGGVASVGPGANPNPFAPPITMTTYSPLELALYVGGNDLPFTAPPRGSGILWNPGGAAGGDIWVA